MNNSLLNVKEKNDETVFSWVDLKYVCDCVFCVCLFTFMFHSKVLVSIPIQRVCVFYSMIYVPLQYECVFVCR